MKARKHKTPTSVTYFTVSALLKSRFVFISQPFYIQSRSTCLFKMQGALCARNDMKQTSKQLFKGHGQKEEIIPKLKEAVRCWTKESLIMKYNL